MTVREVIDAQKIYIFDGAMGTLFAQQHPDYEKPCEMACMEHPEYITAIHKSYIEAGCSAIKTNTFAVNPLNELYAADPELMKQVLTAGWKTASAAAEGTGAEVFADIGPVPSGAQAGEEEKAKAFCSVCRVFLDLGAKNFIFETNSSDEGIAAAAAYIREQSPDAFIIASFAVQPDGYTRDGQYIGDIAQRMAEGSAVDAMGMNCVSSALHMRHLLESIQETVQTSGKMLCAMPNAGYPKVIGNRVYYDSDPSYFAEQTVQMAGLGAAIVGGCCGTGEQHIRALAEKAGAFLREEKAPAKVRPAGRAAAVRSAWEHVSDTAHNLFAAKLDQGHKVIAVELDPPRNSDIAKYMSGAWTLKEAGVDAITIADCATARASMDSSIIACKLRRELGIDTIPHMTCRDRNLNATKALLMALSTEGVANVLAITGDPVPSAERDEVKSVFQFNSRMLASFIRSLNENEFRRPMRIYGALNINVRNFDRELERTVKKVENGMKGFLTQPVLTQQAAENLKKAYEILRPLDAKLLGGIIPVVSSRNARFMDSEISGINVDPAVTEMYEGKSRDECTELAVELSTRIARGIRGFVDGYYLMTPFSRTDIMSRLVHNIREMDL